MIRKSIATSAIASVFLMGLGLSGTASAAFQTCVNGPADAGADYNILNKVTTATDCAILLPLGANDNDSPQPGFVNAQAFFGYSNWFFDGKSSGEGAPNLFTFSSAGGQSGTFTFNGPAGSISDFMFVFKDGADTNLVGYLVTAASGSWSTPFTEPPFTFAANNAKDVSHVSIYYRTDGVEPPAEIPEPGTLALVGLALMGAASVRRRRV